MTPIGLNNIEVDDSLTQEEAMLLLHAAGELDGPARVQFDERLLSDAALRERMSSLTDFDDALRHESIARPVAAGDSRRALAMSLRLVREQALLLQSRPKISFARFGFAGVPRWAWGTAIAACLAVGTVVWISNSDPTSLAPGNIAMKGSDNIDGTSRPAEFGSLAAAFDSIEPAGSAAPSADIDSQVDALKMLAAMDDVN